MFMSCTLQRYGGRKRRAARTVEVALAFVLLSKNNYVLSPTRPIARFGNYTMPGRILVYSTAIWICPSSGNPWWKHSTSIYLNCATQ